MLYRIGRRECFELDANQPFRRHWPINALRSQRITGPHHIDEIPPRITLLVLPRVGIIKISVQRIARDFVVESQ